MKKQNLLLLGILSLGCLIGCSPADPSNPTSGPSNGPTIDIACVKLGYGTEWLSALMNAYTAKTGVRFNFQEAIGMSGNNNLDDQIRSLTGAYDIYGLRPNSFFEFLYKGSITAGGQKYDTTFEPLNDIYTSAYEGEMGNNTMLSKMYPEFSNYVHVNNNYYGVPWANGFVSFVRNLDVWEEFGFSADEYPRTTDELFEMMDAMNAKIATGDKKYANKAPMMYCKKDEYYSTILGSWFSQYEDAAAMEKFYNGRNPDGNYDTDLFTYDGIYESLSVMQKIVEFDSQTRKYKYQHISSNELEFTQAQDFFLLGRSALYVNGTWLEVESNRAKTSNVDFIKIPLISSVTDKLSKDYTDLQLREMVSYVDAHIEVGDNANLPEGVLEEDIEIVRDSRNRGSYVRSDLDHLFVIPSWSDKKTEAKEFLKWMYSDEALQIFYDTMKGHHLPATPSTGSYSKDNTTLSKIRISAVKAMEENKFCLYQANTVKDKMFSIAKVQPNFSNTIAKIGNCINWLIDGMTPDQIIAENTNYMTTKWEHIRNCLDKDQL